MTVAAGPWKKDPKAVMKKITKALQLPDDGEGDDGGRDRVLEGGRRREGDDGGDRTRRSGAGQEGDRRAGELRLHQGELCGQAGPERAGRGRGSGRGVLRQLRQGDGAEEWAVGAVYELPGLLGDPPCKTIRKLTQKVQQKPPVQLDEACPKCGKPLLLRDGQYGEFIACSGYPKCKYVKQELLDVPCPKDGGDIAVRKTKRGDVFYGCVNYPKCDFASNLKLVNQTCPKCDSAYLLEVANDKGTYLVCPNNREALPKRRKKKGAPEEEPTTPECSYQKKIAGAGAGAGAGDA